MLKKIFCYFSGLFMIFLFSENGDYFSENSQTLINKLNNNCLVDYNTNNEDLKNSWYKLGDVEIDFNNGLGNYTKFLVSIDKLQQMNGNPVFMMNYRVQNNSYNPNNVEYSNNSNCFINNCFVFYVNSSIFDLKSNNNNKNIDLDVVCGLCDYDPLKKQYEEWYKYDLSFSINMTQLLNININKLSPDNIYELQIPSKIWIEDDCIKNIESNYVYLNINFVINNYKITNFLDINNKNPNINFANKISFSSNNDYESNFNDLDNSDSAKNGILSFYISTNSYFDYYNGKVYKINSNSNTNNGLSIDYYDSYKIYFQDSLTLNLGISFVYNFEFQYDFKSIFQNNFNNYKYESNINYNNGNKYTINFDKKDIENKIK